MYICIREIFLFIDFLKVFISLDKKAYEYEIKCNIYFWNANYIFNYFGPIVHLEYLRELFLGTAYRQLYKLQYYELEWNI